MLTFIAMEQVHSLLPSGLPFHHHSVSAVFAEEFSSAYTAELPARVIAMTTASIAALLLFFLIHISLLCANMESITMNLSYH